MPDTDGEAAADSTATQEKPRRTSTSSLIAQISMAVLFALAVIATTVMVFTDNALWMRVGLLAALWSALVAAFLFARERRHAGIAEQREAELKRVYSLELESEVAARREHDLRVKESLREEVRSESEDSLNALRVQVMALRSQLEQLGVQPIVDGGKAVPGAAARRIVEAAPGGAGITFADTDAPAPVDGFAALLNQPPAPDAVPQTPPRPTIHGTSSNRDDTPSTEVTSQLHKVDSATPPRPQQPEPTAPRRADSAADRDDIHVPIINSEQWTKQFEREMSWEAISARHSEPRTPSSTPEASSAPSSAEPAQPTEPEAPHNRHGNTGGTSVAELIARLGGDGAANSRHSRRHRHSAEDE